MTNPIEDRLREAYQAKTAQLTERRLDQLAERRERAMDDLLDAGHTGELPVLGFEEVPASPRHRWIAPGLAAAAVVALAVGATALVVNRLDQPRPNSPISQVIHPSPSSTPTPSATGSSTPSTSPTPSATPSQTQPSQSTHPALPYLPAGRAGSRDQVPWAIVGSGWRLLQPTESRSLYLYDPGAGRYLITDQLPAGSKLAAWSPDGQRAMVTVTPSLGLIRTTFYEVRLRSGAVTRELQRSSGLFIAYTEPDGVGYLVAEDSGDAINQLSLYSVSGKRLVTYPQFVGRNGVSTEHAVEFPGGTVAIGSTHNTVVFDGAGHYLRSLPTPAGAAYCQPLKSWSTTSVLTKCSYGSGSMLLIQPLSGAAPTTLASASEGVYGYGYTNAWPLSNGDILLLEWADCGANRYAILAGNGAIRPLRGPRTSTGVGNLLDEEGDSAVFAEQDRGCGYGKIQYSIVQYQLMTGQAYQLFDGPVALASWPGGPSGVE